VPTRRPAAALALAAGLVVIVGGTAGLLLTRHSTPAMELRLITCGGAFDAATGHYLSNIVVYATEVR